MKKQKIMIAAVVLLLVFMVGGAIAYFTDTDDVTNTFTLGKVDIELDEPNWAANNGQNIVPGKNITKDPTITVGDNSNDAYLFATVEVPCLDTTELFTYSLESGWVELSENVTCDSTTKTAKHIYGYGTASEMSAVSAGTAKKLFSSVTFANLNNLTAAQAEEIATMEMPITAYGIQTEGLASSDPLTIFGYFS